MVMQKLSFLAAEHENYCECFTLFYFIVETTHKEHSKNSRSRILVLKESTYMAYYKQ